MVIPIFKSHHSIGRSILTLEKASEPGKIKENIPASIIDIAIEEKLDKVFLVETSYASLMEAEQALKPHNIKLFFGIEVIAVEDIDKKDEESLKTEHKINIIALNNTGEDKLRKIYSRAANAGLYYVPRIDLKYLRDNWSDDLMLWIPFYDSFIHKNAVGVGCVPNFGKIKKRFLWQDNCLPLDTLIQKSLINLGDEEFIKAKSIYYKNRSDFKDYLAFRCIQNRTTVRKPELNQFSSNEFCVESWREQNKQ